MPRNASWIHAFQVSFQKWQRRWHHEEFWKHLVNDVLPLGTRLDFDWAISAGLRWKVWCTSSLDDLYKNLMVQKHCKKWNKIKKLAKHLHARPWKSQKLKRSHRWAWFSSRREVDEESTLLGISQDLKLWRQGRIGKVSKVSDKNCGFRLIKSRVAATAAGAASLRKSNLETKQLSTCHLRANQVAKNSRTLLL